MTGKITIDTDYPISITTDRPVSIRTEGGTTTVQIGGADPAEREERPGLAIVPREPDPAEALIPDPGPARPKGPRCGVIMKRSQKPCARLKDHNGVHMNAQQIKNKQKYNADAARQRYHDDPEFAEQVKAASRASYANRTGGASTTE